MTSRESNVWPAAAVTAAETNINAAVAAVRKNNNPRASTATDMRRGTATRTGRSPDRDAAPIRMPAMAGGAGATSAAAGAVVETVEMPVAGAADRAAPPRLR